jgi:hypothetical protein
LQMYPRHQANRHPGSPFSGYGNIRVKIGHLCG